MDSEEETAKEHMHFYWTGLPAYGCSFTTIKTRVTSYISGLIPNANRAFIGTNTACIAQKSDIPSAKCSFEGIITTCIAQKRDFLTIATGIGLFNWRYYMYLCQLVHITTAKCDQSILSKCNYTGRITACITFDRRYATIWRGK